MLLASVPEQRASRKPEFPAIASAVAVAIAGVVVLALHDLGPQAAHMAVHIGFMNVIAPFVAAVVLRAVDKPTSAVTLWAAAGGQIALLWIWHAPIMQRVALEWHALQFVMHGSLLLIATLFWCAVLGLRGRMRWHGAAALLLNGKLACLLGAPLIFAPRLLLDTSSKYESLSLADQQFAGLLMVTACPLSYVLAGVAFAAQALFASGKSCPSYPAAT